MHCKRYLPILLVLCFLLSSCGPAAGREATPSPAATAQQPDSPAVSAQPMLYPFQEGSERGGYREEDLSDFFKDRILAGNFGQDDLFYALTNEYKLVNTDLAFMDWKQIPEFDWLTESPEISPYYFRNFIILPDLKYLGVVSGQLKTDEIVDKNKLVYGDADDYSILLTGDWLDAVFDMDHHRCVLLGFTQGIVYDYIEKKELATIEWALSGTKQSGDMTIVDDILYEYNSSDDWIYRYDLDTGERLEHLSLPRLNSIFSAFGSTYDHSALLRASIDGLSSISLAGEITPLLPAENTVLSQPSIFYNSLLQLSDGSILVNVSFPNRLDLPNYGIIYCRYTYDPNKDNTSAADPLTIFSLDENKTLLEAVSIAQQDGMAIDYSVGIDGGVLPDDAIRSLLTQLLAGSGPDVIALDGLPLSQLAFKGALLDLQTLLPSGCLDNITASFRQEDGAVFTIPARFFLPTLLGKDISNVSGLPALASWTQSHPYQDLGIGPPRLLPQFFPLYAHSWIVDGKLQEDAFRTDLEALGRLGQMWLDSTVKDHRYLENDAPFLVYQWFSDTQAGAFGWYGSVRSLVQPYSALQQKEGQFLPFGDGVFLPACMMGINAASPKQEQAQAFLSTLFSDKVQGADLQDGFPVLLSSLEKQMEQMEPGTDMGAMEITWNEPYAEAMTMKLNWPTKEDFASLLDAMKQLTKAGETDRALQDLLTEETLDYIRGEQSLDQCLQALKSKLDIYLAE